MRKEGYSETTIERYVRLLKELAKHGDLQDPESVKVGLTRTGWADGTKEMACGTYAQGGETSMIRFRYAFQRVPLMYEKLVATFMGAARGASPKNTLLIYGDVRTHGLAFTSDSQL
jgi:hypothetical protein